MRNIAFSLNAWVVFFLTGRFPASVPGSADSRWHVHEPAHGLTASVPAGLVSRQLLRRRFQSEVPGRRGSIPGLHLPGGEGRLHELPTRLLPAKLCLPILKCQPPGWWGGASPPDSRRQGNWHGNALRYTLVSSRNKGCYTHSPEPLKTNERNEKRRWEFFFWPLLQRRIVMVLTPRKRDGYWSVTCVEDTWTSCSKVSHVLYWTVEFSKITAEKKQRYRDHSDDCSPMKVIFFLCLPFICWFNIFWLTSKHLQLALLPRRPYCQAAKSTRRRTSGYVGDKISGLFWLLFVWNERHWLERNRGNLCKKGIDCTPRSLCNWKADLLGKAVSFSLALVLISQWKNLQQPSGVLPLTSSFSYSPSL